MSSHSDFILANARVVLADAAAASPKLARVARPGRPKTSLAIS